MKHLIKYINMEAVVELGKLRVDVLILDVKTSYGNDRFLVEPIRGSGKIWVEKIIIKEE